MIDRVVFAYSKRGKVWRKVVSKEKIDPRKELQEKINDLQGKLRELEKAEYIRKGKKLVGKCFRLGEENIKVLSQDNEGSLCVLRCRLEQYKVLGDVHIDSCSYGVNYIDEYYKPISGREFQKVLRKCLRILRIIQPK